MGHRAHARAAPLAARPCPRRSESEVLEPYVEDASGFTGRAELLLLPDDEAQVSTVLREAVRTETPVTVSGAGTGLTGARVAQGGWVLSVERLNRILEIGPGGARIQPGVLLKELQAAAQQTGQFYPPDPTEIHASIGGTIACNASGARSFKYGATRRHVRRLRLVLPNGDLLELVRGEVTANAAGCFQMVLASGDTREIRLPNFPMPATTKHSAGYWFRPGMDLVDLFIGAEGTLGVVTEAELALLPWPGEVLGGVIFYSSERAALDFATRAQRLAHDSQWVGPACARLLEFFDHNSLALLRLHRYPEIPVQAQAAILLEQEIGSSPREEVAERWLEVIGEQDALLEDSWFAVSAAEREKFREFRHAIALIVNDTARLNGYPKLATDQAVPVERTQEILAFYHHELDVLFAGANPPQYTIFGHIGDGHLHVNMLPTNEADFGAAKALLSKFAEQAVKLGGTVGAEHGLGKSKAHLLKLLYPPEVLEAMWRIKLALDPKNLLNRGNLFGTSPLLQPA